MNRLQLPHAKIFYVIAELSKKQSINDTEKRVLKEKVISDDIEIFQLLDKYEKTKDEDDFANDLIKLVQNKPSFGLHLNDPAGDDNEQQEKIKPSDTGVVINTEPQVSSPVGTLLHRKKYEHSLNLNNEINRMILQPCKPQAQ